MFKKKREHLKKTTPNSKGRFGSSQGRVMCVSLSDCSDCCLVVQNHFSMSRFPFSFHSFLKQPEAISEDERSGGEGTGPHCLVIYPPSLHHRATVVQILYLSYYRGEWGGEVGEGWGWEWE